jgi:hypothetical protein
VLQRTAQTPVIVVFDCDEAKRLQYAIRDVSHRAKDFRHPVHWSRLRLKGNFDEIALTQRMGHAQEATGSGNGLEFGFSAAAVF